MENSIKNLIDAEDKLMKSILRYAVVEEGDITSLESVEAAIILDCFKLIEANNKVMTEWAKTTDEMNKKLDELMKVNKK